MPVKNESLLLHFPSWQRRFESALSETDALALFKKIEIAESAMLARRDILTDVKEYRSESQALDEAVAILSVFKKKRLNF